VDRGGSNYVNRAKAQTRINSNGNEVNTWRFQTFSHEAFNPLAEVFLSVQGKKRVKDGLIRDHLTPRGLAYWFMQEFFPRSAKTDS
jgi:hypothetical protein